MNAHFQVEKPDNIRFTLTATMTLGEWKKVKESLGSTSHGSDIFWKIADMIQKAGETFEPAKDY